jgi:hypothetical protein
MLGLLGLMHLSAVAAHKNEETIVLEEDLQK